MGLFVCKCGYAFLAWYFFKGIENGQDSLGRAFISTLYIGAAGLNRIEFKNKNDLV